MVATQALPVGIIRQNQLHLLQFPCASRGFERAAFQPTLSNSQELSLPRYLCKDWSHEGSAVWIRHSSMLNFVLLTSFSLYCPQVVPCLGALPLLRCCDTGNGQPGRQHVPHAQSATCIYPLEAGAVRYSLTPPLCRVVVSLQLK